MEYLALYAVVLVTLWALYVRRQRRIERVHAQQLQQSLEAGLGERVAAPGDRPGALPGLEFLR